MNTEGKADATPAHDADWYVDHLLADVERFATVLDTGATDAPVAGCPGWDVARLALHLGVIHRWARHCAAEAAPPDGTDQFEPEAGTDLAAWLRDGAGALADVLRTLDPDAPTWHPFPVARVGRVWPRRQAHEASVHRWDAERAVGAAAPIDPELASDGIDEYFEIAVPRLVKREGLTLPTGSFHVHCTDVAGEWLVWSDAEGLDGYHLVRAHEKGDAALRGPAEAVLLRLWGRDGDRADELSPVGEPTVLDAWLSIHGM